MACAWGYNIVRDRKSQDQCALIFEHQPMICLVFAREKILSREIITRIERTLLQSTWIKRKKTCYATLRKWSHAILSKASGLSLSLRMHTLLVVSSGCWQLWPEPVAQTPISQGHRMGCLPPTLAPLNPPVEIGSRSPPNPTAHSVPLRPPHALLHWLLTGLPFEPCAELLKQYTCLISTVHHLSQILRNIFVKGSPWTLRHS